MEGITVSGGYSNILVSRYGSLILVGCTLTGCRDSDIWDNYHIAGSIKIIDSNLSYTISREHNENYKVTISKKTTQTFNGVAVTLYFDDSNNLIYASGNNVYYDLGKFSIGNQTYDNTNVSFENATYTKTIDGVDVSFTFNSSNVLQNATGNGVTYENRKFIVKSDGSTNIGNFERDNRRMLQSFK